jgi:hypothetical protein
LFTICSFGSFGSSPEAAGYRCAVIGQASRQVLVRK